MNEIHKNKYDIHKNRTLVKKPGQTPAIDTYLWSLSKSKFDQSLINKNTV